MRGFVADVLEAAGASREDAELMGEILVDNDLRCIFSHGTQQIVTYARNMIEGKVNPRPQVTVVRESPGSLVLDGDGGLGYFPCHRGTAQIIDKAKKCGVAALTTGNHHHFGAASNYSRQALAQDCIGISISSSRSSPDPEQMLSKAMSGSPFSFAIPAGDQPPLILDTGGMGVGFSPESFEANPAPLFKALGLATVIQVLGGVVPGIYRDEVKPPRSRWESNQGAFIIVIDANQFMPIEELRKEMDAFVGLRRSMKPLPGLDRAELAGGFEWAWAKENEIAGILVDEKHEAALTAIAAEVGVETPFARHEGTRS
jgi:LDH2 family malate/lactate/ureidoglycolate dehydrogenase